MISVLRLPKIVLTRIARPITSARRRRADRSAIKRYLAQSAVARLHLGCGGHPLPGWLNSDVESNGADIVELDATQRFPSPDGVFDFVFSEHMIEHLAYPAAKSMLDECFRTLKPGGALRVSTPDLAFLLALFNERLTATQQQYLEWATETFIGTAPRPEAVYVLNNFVRDWGHQFIYDEQTLRELLERCGFVDVVRCELNESQYPALRSLENESRMPPGFLRLETMTFEASKPRKDQLSFPGADR